MSELPPWLSQTDSGLIVAVKAVPRARRTQAVAIHDGLLRVQIAAPPHQGQSNTALRKYLGSVAGVRTSAVRLHRGSSGARKLIEIDGDTRELRNNLVAAFGDLPHDG